jgi:hypothetical protein
MRKIIGPSSYNEFPKRNGNQKQCFVSSKYNTANVLFHFVHIMRKNTEIKKAKRSN